MFFFFLGTEFSRKSGENLKIMNPQQGELAFLFFLYMVAGLNQIFNQFAGYLRSKSYIFENIH